MSNRKALEEILHSHDFVLLLPNPSEGIASAFKRKLGHCKGMIIEGEAARQILALYSLYEFSDKIIIGSFDEPYGRKLRNLLNSGVATEEELINEAILRVM